MWHLNSKQDLWFCLFDDYEDEAKSKWECKMAEGVPLENSRVKVKAFRDLQEIFQTRH